MRSNARLKSMVASALRAKMSVWLLWGRPSTMSLEFVCLALLLHARVVRVYMLASCVKVFSHTWSICTYTQERTERFALLIPMCRFCRLGS